MPPERDGEPGPGFSDMPEPDVLSEPSRANAVVSDRALVALTLLLAAMLVVVAVVSHTPALHPVPVPSVGRA